MAEQSLVAVASTIDSAQVVVECAELDPTLCFFRDELGFVVEAIFPADAPHTAVIVAHGVRLRLVADRTRAPAPSRIRLLCDDPAVLARALLRPGGGGTPPAPPSPAPPSPSSSSSSPSSFELRAPNGSTVELVPADPPVVLPPLVPAWCYSDAAAADYAAGRAGMQYRDLVPDRQGGRYIASHIKILEGGPVPDYVHYHKVGFQMIYVRTGEVKVVYEDQGAPFVMRAGDCVVQPPTIRHRVLESTAGLEVVEIGCPAEHETFADLVLALPTPQLRPERLFGGQRFCWHRAQGAAWAPWRLGGLEARDTGIGDATAGVASVRVARVAAAAAAAGASGGGGGARRPQPAAHDADFMLHFVLSGTASVRREGYAGGPQEQALKAGDSCVVPAGEFHALHSWSDDFQVLEVTLPATVRWHSSSSSSSSSGGPSRL